MSAESGQKLRLTAFTSLLLSQSKPEGQRNNRCHSQLDSHHYPTHRLSPLCIVLVCSIVPASITDHRNTTPPYHRAIASRPDCLAARHAQPIPMKAHRLRRGADDDTARDLSQNNSMSPASGFILSTDEYCFSNSASRGLATSSLRTIARPVVGK